MLVKRLSTPSVSIDLGKAVVGAICVCWLALLIGIQISKGSEILLGTLVINSYKEG